MQIRKALPAEYDVIFLMGFDTWGEGSSTEIYLDECRNSPKYNRGCWYVLMDETGTLLSSLISYSLSTDACGIGSIATPVSLRNRGYASKFITAALNLFQAEGFRQTFLFSDIEVKFYEQFGFVSLPLKYQYHEGSVCMVRGIGIEAMERGDSFQVPRYF